MPISTFVKSISFHFRHPIKVINLCMGQTEFRRVKRRSIPWVVREQIQEIAKSNSNSAWYFNLPDEYPMSQAFEVWAYANGVYKEVDFYEDYGLDESDYDDLD
jgi:hypothetical protein